MYNVSALLLRYANYDDVQSLFALINESNYQIIILWDVIWYHTSIKVGETTDLVLNSIPMYYMCTWAKIG